MRRFSIARLMGVILVVALCTAALREASDHWAGIALAALLVLLATAILQAIYHRATRRAFWMGFALFGWGYLILVMGPWFSEYLGPKLPTSLLLEFIHQKVVDPSTTTGATLLSTVAISPNGTWQPSRSSGEIVYQLSNVNTPPSKGDRYLRMLFSGASRYEPFVRTGQSVFALLVALLGGV
jgi:hypothetical protein